MVHSLQWSAPPGRWSSWVDFTQIDLTWVNLYLARERGPEIQPDWRHFDEQYSAEFWAVSWVWIVVQFPDQFNPASWPFTHSQGRVFIMIKWSNSSNCVREPVQRTQPCGTGRLACERVFIRLCLQSRDPQMDYTYGKYMWPRNLFIKFYMWVWLLKSEHNLCVFVCVCVFDEHQHFESCLACILSTVCIFLTLSQMIIMSLLLRYRCCLDLYVLFSLGLPGL